MCIDIFHSVVNQWKAVLHLVELLKAHLIRNPEFLIAELAISRLFDLLVPVEDFFTIRHLIPDQSCHLYNDEQPVIKIRCK